jgi:hypothetical protein
METTNTEDPMKFYAKFANGAYDKVDMSHMGWNTDTELSNRNRQVYHHPESNKAIVAYRGTSLNSKSKWGDLGSDALLAIGLKGLSSRFKNAKKVAQATADKYGQDNVVLTGHSLGGSQALYANSKLGLETHGYNAGVSPSDATQGIKKKVWDKLTFGLFKKPVKPNATIYTTGKDPISILSPMVANAQTKFVKKKKGVDAHALANFL